MTTATEIYEDIGKYFTSFKPMDLEENTEKSYSNLINVHATQETKQEKPHRITYKCFKRRKGSNSYEVVIVREKWDIENSVPKLISKMQTVNTDKIISRDSEKSPDDHRSPLKDFDIELSKCNDDNKNLSWLLNFKVETLFRGLEGCHVNDEEKKSRRSSTGRKSDSGRISNPNLGRKCLQEQKQSQENRREDEEFKPPFTYTELIEQALNENGEMTVSEIYQWITKHYPYYKSTDDRWKNSVRHNLSINPYFRKGGKALHGAGHLWTTAAKEEGDNERPQQKKKRLTSENDDSFDEVRAATASIENKENRAVYNEVLLSVAALDEDIEKNDSGYVDELTMSHSLSLEQSAEQILSGIKRNVEVQYIIPLSEDTSHGEERKPLMEIQNIFPMVVPKPFDQSVPFPHPSAYYNLPAYPQVIKVDSEDFLNIGNEVEICTENPHDSITLTNLSNSPPTLEMMESGTIFSDELISFPFYDFAASAQLPS